MTLRQQAAYDALENLGIFTTLKAYHPLLAGTMPIDIDIPDSDLDIICDVADFDVFEQDVRQAYEHCNAFALYYQPDRRAIVASFQYAGFLIEIFGENKPTHQQNAYRHMLIEERLLKMGGQAAKTAIRELKRGGLKTEPAFAKYFKLSGDPYETLLQLADLTDDELIKERIVLNMPTLTDQIMQSEENYIVQTYKRPPFVIVHGERVTLYDTEGNAYTDWVAGIAVNALGYGDKGIEQVISRQLANGIIHVSNLYHTAPHAELAKLLVEKSFADRVFFCNSGAEANEAAIKFARKRSYINGQQNKQAIVSFSGAFHGRTMGALALTPREKYQEPFKPLMPGSIVAEFNNIESATAAINANTAAVFVEPVQGEGGVHPATTEFLQALRALCDEHDALLVFDEVQCGLGRTGTLWAYEHSGVVPDIMTLAKPLAGGLPIGAVLVTEKVASNLVPGDHGSTFAGGLLVTGVAREVVTRISEPGFLEQVQVVGNYLMERLAEINSPLIKEVRGRGLMVALELTIETAPLIEDGYKNGLILVNAGANVLRFVPPLIVGKSHVDVLVERLTVMLANAIKDA